MKIRIKYEFTNKLFYYIVSENSKMLQNIERKNKKLKKVINRCLKRYLPKKISGISKLLNVSEWNISCKVISGYINDYYLKIIIKSSDGRVFGNLNMDSKSLCDDSDQEQDNDNDTEFNPLREMVMMHWIKNAKIDSKKQLTLDKIKNDNINLVLNLRLQEGIDLYKDSEFLNMKEVQNDLLKYLERFNINITFNHFILVEENAIKWHPRYIRFNKDDNIKEVIAQDLLVSYTDNISEHYLISNISNNFILKSFIKQNILNIDNFDDNNEVTKEEIKEYFEIEKMCSY